MKNRLLMGPLSDLLATRENDPGSQIEKQDESEKSEKQETPINSELKKPQKSMPARDSAPKKQ